MMMREPSCRRRAAALSIALAAAAGGAASAQECDRDCLENWVDVYLDALVAGDPAAAPMADDVVFTANGQRLPVGEGLWRTMKDKGTYRLFVTDVPAQQVTVMTTFMEDGPAPEDPGAGGALALRLKIEEGSIAEIEQIEIRSATQYARMESFGRPRDAYFETVPEENRMSRRALVETANKYFTGMQMNDGQGDYPFAEDCDRRENGNQSTNAPTPPGETRPDPETATSYSAQWTCLEQFQSGLLAGVSLIRDRRYVAVDEERGLVWAFGFFDHHRVRDFQTVTLPGGEQQTSARARPWTWHIAEVFKVEDGLIHEIDAYLYEPPYGMDSGWSDWDDAMSDEIQNATGVPFE